MISIQLERKTYFASVEVIASWLPRLLGDFDKHGCIDANIILDDLLRTLHHSSVSRNTISTSMKSLLSLLRPFSRNNITDGISKTFRTLLTQDYHDPVHSLSRTRNHFLTLTLLASQTRSDKLAKALISAFKDCTETLVVAEDDLAIYQWVIALSGLRGLASKSAVNDCLQRLSSRGHGVLHAHRAQRHHSGQIEEFMRLLAQFVEVYYGRVGRPAERVRCAEEFPRARRAHDPFLRTAPLLTHEVEPRAMLKPFLRGRSHSRQRYVNEMHQCEKEALKMPEQPRGHECYDCLRGHREGEFFDGRY